MGRQQSIGGIVRSVLLVALAGGTARAQDTTDFKARAFIPDSMTWAPFYVTEMEPLREAIRANRVDEDTPVLVLERRGTRLALVTAQLAYHHAAQGDIEGEPWMVSF